MYVAVYERPPDVRQLSVTPAGRLASQGRDADVSGLSMRDQSYAVQSQPRRREVYLWAAGIVPVLCTFHAALDAATTRGGDVPGQVRWPLPRLHHLPLRCEVLDVFGCLDVHAISSVSGHRTSLHICQCLCSLFAGIIAADVHDVNHPLQDIRPLVNGQSSNTFQRRLRHSFVVNTQLLADNGQRFDDCLCLCLCVCLSVCHAERRCWCWRGDSWSWEVTVQSFFHACHLHHTENCFQKMFFSNTVKVKPVFPTLNQIHLTTDVMAWMELIIMFWCVVHRRWSLVSVSFSQNSICSATLIAYMVFTAAVRWKWEICITIITIPAS